MGNRRGSNFNNLIASVNNTYFIVKAKKKKNEIIAQGFH